MTRTIIILSLLVALVVAGQKCKPGVSTLSPDGCNICTCTPDGVIDSCTQRACVNIDDSPVLRQPSKRATPSRRCKPGTRVPAGDGCNFCICNGQGKARACTLKACL